MFQRIANGRTDLVFDHVADGGLATAADADGVSLIRWCAYYGDVSAIRHLLEHGESLASLGDNHDLNGAAFHGHWQLCQFLLEQGADPNRPLPDTGETPLHAVLANDDRVRYDLAMEALPAHGADPNRATRPGTPTGAFMLDCRTRGEAPLHRAAAFGGERTTRMLLDAGAALDAKDAYGDSPLGRARWYRRPRPILRLLRYGAFRIPGNDADLRTRLLGKPHD